MNANLNNGAYVRQRLSANLKRYRAERNLSQEKMAELAGFHRTYVSQLERCTTNISVDGLERLASALNIDVVALLEPVQISKRKCLKPNYSE